MNQGMQITEGKTLTVAEVKASASIIRQVMKDGMEKDKDYGTIPGCGGKPTLFKPGSEKILSTFRIAVNPVVEDLSGPDEARYRVTAHATSMVTGLSLGAGIGEASTSENKYQWRAAVCDEEYNETPEDRRRAVWKRGYNGKPNYQIKQVRTNPSDLANTVLKMAKKRAQIDMTLTVTAASDVFSQDIEDLDKELRGVVSEPGIQEPQRESETGAPAAKAVAPATASENVVTGIPEAYSVKTGVKNDKKWEKHSALLNGEWYGTFSKTDGDMLKTAKESGLVVLVGYKEDKYGRNAESVTLVESMRPDDPVTPVGQMADPNAVEDEPPIGDEDISF